MDPAEHSSDDPPADPVAELERLVHQVAPTLEPEDATRLRALTAAVRFRHGDLAANLVDSATRFDTVMDALPGGVLVRDAQGLVTFTNRWLTDYLGIAPDDVMGTPPGVPYRLIDERQQPLAPHEYPSSRAARGERFDSIVVGVPNRSGEIRWLATSGRPIVDTDGAAGGGLILFVDSTELVESRRRIARSESQLREAERVGGIGSWVRDIEQQTVSVSGEFRRQLGIGPDEPVDRESLYRVIHPDDRAAVFEGTYAAFTDGSPYRVRFRIQHHELGERMVEFHAERYLGADGRPVGLIGTVRDITEQLEEEERLAQVGQTQVIGQLAGGLAHDFNNLLTVLTGHAELLRLGASSDQLASIDAIADTADRAAHLIRQLLEFGRRDVLQPRPVVLNDLVADLCELATSVVPSMIDLRVDLADDLPVGRLDPTKIEQVVLNLVLNARDALVDHGTITVRTGVAAVEHHPVLADGVYVSVQVVDDGPGMTPDVLHRVFEPYYTTKPFGSGTGLGLPTAAGIAAQSGGHLSLASTPGRGTTATVLLPTTSDPVDEPAQRATADRARSAPATVLLAEDDDHLRPLLARVLTRRGHRVLVARDGREALEVAAGSRERLDLLVTDVSMPRRNGHELSVALTAVHAGLRTLYMSGYTENSVVVGGIANREIHFLAKPFSIDRFVEVVESLLLTPAAPTVDG